MERSHRLQRVELRPSTIKPLAFGLDVADRPIGDIPCDENSPESGQTPTR